MFRISLFVVLLTSLFVGVLSAQKKGDPKAPDLTQGGERPADWTHDWNLGPTGARGWMHSNKLTTTDARQILVTAVEKGSPAHKKLRVGDVIVGVRGKLFDGDPRIQLGRAITAAEGRADRGRLRLRVWRKKRVRDIALTLKRRGDYAPTAPYDCKKSAAVAEQALADLAARMKDDPRKGHIIPRAINALALLASGDKKYLPLVREQVEILSEFNQEKGVRTWSYAYVNLFLAEYVLAIGDRRAVKKGLRRITKRIIEGQSEVGSWGHDFIRGEPLRIGGYGMMNAPGIPLTYSLALAREAGVKPHGIDEAIERSARLLRFYVGKGSIPYGDHRPWIETHCDNGKNESAAVLFDLLGDIDAVTYFSRMGVASHNAERDTGHTGNYFNLLWALPGIARSGPAATGAWIEEFGWYFDLARSHDGHFGYPGAPTKKPEVYAKWDATGAYLLAYLQPRRATFTTGKRASVAPALDKNEAAAMVERGQGWTNADRHSFAAQFSKEELLARLEDWSPVVRERAAIELGRRRKLGVTPELRVLLKSKRTHARDGACRALKHQRKRGAAAVADLRETLKDQDMWIRILAAEALAGIGAPARVAVPDLLTMLTRTPGQADPRDMERRYLTQALFNRREGLIGKSLEGVDRPLLLQAVRASLGNEDGRARGAVASVYRNLDFEQLRPLIPAILEAIAKPAPTGIMFAHEIRIEGLKVLAKHHVEDAMPLLVDYARNQKKHGSEKRLKNVLELLEGYGAHAQRTMPQLKKLAEYFDGGEEFYPERLSKEKAKWVRETIARIKASRERPALTTLG